MQDKKQEELYNLIKRDCLTIIKEKDIDIKELAYRLGVTFNSFIDAFQNNLKDFTFYLETYHLLNEWTVDNNA